MINHRSREFASLIRECVAGIQWALQTANDILLFPASGTGGLEAVVVNLLSPDEPVLFVSMGWYGDLWADMAMAFGADVTRLSVPWGEAVDPAALGTALDANPRIRKVFLTHNETSTAAMNDMRTVSSIVKARGCLLAVDSVSGAGCLPLHVDELGIDAVVTSSQKGWLAPPGLTMIALSCEAFAAAAQSRCPRWYFDFHLQRGFQDKNETHMTPPISVMFALREGLAMMREEGLEGVWQRHHEVAAIIRSGLAKLGLKLFAASACRSDSVTAVVSPFGSREALRTLLDKLRDRYALVVAEGHGALNGRIFRVGHLGAIAREDAYQIVERIGRALSDQEGLSP